MKVSNLFLAIALVAIYVQYGVSNAMRRLIYNRSGSQYRLSSMKLVREYRSQFGKDRNY